MYPNVPKCIHHVPKIYPYTQNVHTNVPNASKCTQVTMYPDVPNVSNYSLFPCSQMYTYIHVPRCSQVPKNTQELMHSSNQCTQVPYVPKYSMYPCTHHVLSMYPYTQHDLETYPKCTQNICMYPSCTHVCTQNVPVCPKCTPKCTYAPKM
jgi:hypothetical protein